MKGFTSVLIIILGIYILFPLKVIADDVTTSVTVGNSAPTFTVAPSENPTSDATTPTNVGSSVTFIATGTDSNAEDYYLAICKTDAITAVNGSSPTCDGGSWCISSATDSGTQSTCSYTALQGDSESNAWFAFVCDGNSSSAECSASSQGSGNSGSPFKVNHPPIFNAITNDGPKDPGSDITWSTDGSTLDNDSDTVADTVKLIICKTSGISNGDCDGGESDRWCQSSLVSDNPTCSYTIPTPTVDQSYNGYAYLIDNHNLGATGGNQGSNSSYTVNNVAPVVTSVTLNGGSDITLTENSTTNVTVTATVTDNNSCQDISSAVTSVYRSGITYSGCDINDEDDNNNCYAVVSCSVGGGNSCDGPSDASASYTCTVALQYHADPTDASTIYVAENWLATVLATDDDNDSDNTELSTGVEVLSLVAYDVTSSIAYGNLSVGESNDPLDKTTTITATGNVGLDQELSGTDMTSGLNSITVDNQKYALASSTAYASGTSLSGTETEVELNVPKTTVTGSPANQDTWWGLLIPLATLPGTYSGTNTIVAVKGETAGW